MTLIKEEDMPPANSISLSALLRRSAAEEAKPSLGLPDPAVVFFPWIDSCFQTLLYFSSTSDIQILTVMLIALFSLAIRII